MKPIIPKYSIGTDDITFCKDKCNNNKCFRHPDNIINHLYPHSYAYLKDTELCPLQDNQEDNQDN